MNSSADKLPRNAFKRVSIARRSRCAAACSPTPESVSDNAYCAPTVARPSSTGSIPLLWSATSAPMTERASIGAARRVPDPGVFKSGWEFAAWLGLTPCQNSSGGKDQLGRITRKDNQHVRRLLIIGAHSAPLNSRVLETTDWVQGLMQRRPQQVVAVALANKMARIASALMARGTSCRVAAAA